MTTKISVYKEASRLLGDYRFASLSDNTATRYAFDDAWDRTVEYVLRAAYWKFALKTIEMEPAASTEPLPGFFYAWDLPCDWLRTHALFTMSGSREAPFDARHQIEQVHTRVRPPLLRYISNDFADAEVWPEHFAQAVAARLAFDCAERITGNPAKAEQMMSLWSEQFQRALAPDAIPEWPWLRFELDGSFYRGTRFMLDNGFWRFAMRTETLDEDTTIESADISAGYSHVFDKPEDWGRSFWVYEPWSAGGGVDIDYRDEGDQIHCNARSVVMRYVSTDGEDAETWSDSFERACLAYLELEEVKRQPDNTAQARAAAYAEAMKNARIKNDMVERAPVNQTSTLVLARRGGYSGNRAREQGWWR